MIMYSAPASWGRSVNPCAGGARPAGAASLGCLTALLSLSTEARLEAMVEWYMASHVEALPLHHPHPQLPRLLLRQLTPASVRRKTAWFRTSGPCSSLIRKTPAFRCLDGGNIMETFGRSDLDRGFRNSNRPTSGEDKTR
jgi:hypothetical protein